MNPVSNVSVTGTAPITPTVTACAQTAWAVKINARARRITSTVLRVAGILFLLLFGFCVQGQRVRRVQGRSIRRTARRTLETEHVKYGAPVPIHNHADRFFVVTFLD